MKGCRAPCRMRRAVFEDSLQQNKRVITQQCQCFDYSSSSPYAINRYLRETERLYGVLDEFAAVSDTLDDPNLHLSADEEVAVTVATKWAKRHNWIYAYDITSEFERLSAKEIVVQNLLEHGSGDNAPRAHL